MTFSFFFVFCDCNIVWYSILFDIQYCMHWTNDVYYLNFNIMKKQNLFPVIWVVIAILSVSLSVYMVYNCCNNNDLKEAVEIVEETEAVKTEKKLPQKKIKEIMEKYEGVVFYFETQEEAKADVTLEGGVYLVKKVISFTDKGQKNVLYLHTPFVEKGMLMFIAKGYLPKPPQNGLVLAGRVFFKVEQGFKHYSGYGFNPFLSIKLKTNDPLFIAFP